MDDDDDDDEEEENEEEEDTSSKTESEVSNRPHHVLVSLPVEEAIVTPACNNDPIKVDDDDDNDEEENEDEENTISEIGSAVSDEPIANQTKVDIFKAALKANDVDDKSAVISNVLTDGLINHVAVPLPAAETNVNQALNIDSIKEDNGNDCDDDEGDDNPSEVDDASERESTISDKANKIIVILPFAETTVIKSLNVDVIKVAADDNNAGVDKKSKTELVVSNRPNQVSVSLPVEEIIVIQALNNNPIKVDDDDDDDEGDDNSSEAKSLILNPPKEDVHPMNLETIDTIGQLDMATTHKIEPPTSILSSDIAAVSSSSTIAISTAHPNNIDPLTGPLLNNSCTSVPPTTAEATLSSTISIPDDTAPTAPTAPAQNPPVIASIVPAVSLNVALEKTPENFEVSEIPSMGVTNVDSRDEGLVIKLHAAKSDNFEQVHWNPPPHTSCLKKREFSIKLKIRVPHFKRSVIGRNGSNRSLISILSPQPPMWSSLSSLRSPKRNSDQEFTQHKSPSKGNASSTDATGYFNRPKLAFSRQGSTVSELYQPPWRPWNAKTKTSSGKPEMIQIPITNFNIMDSESVVKKILSVLPPLHSIASQYESSDIFLHRILKAYQTRCRAIDNTKQLEDPSKSTLQQDTMSKEIDLSINEKESTCNQTVSDAGDVSIESSSVHTPVRPSPSSPSSSTRSPRALSLLNSQESPNPSTAQKTPINSVVKSILNTSTIKMTPRRLRFSHIKKIDKRASKLLTPTRASTASKYQRQFFCADNRQSMGPPRFLTSKNISCQTENISSAN